LNPKRTRLSRAELYEKVWSTPILQLAQDFGLSDVGLAKICRRHGIPLPGLGYWRKRETGHDPGRVALPPPERVGLESVEIVASQKPADILAYLATQEEPKISVPSNFTLSHPLTLRTEKLLARGQRDEKGLLMPKEGGYACHIHVSKDSLPRALSILEAFLRGCDQKQYALQWPKEVEARLSVSVMDETIQFQISELTKAKPHILTAEEQRRSWSATKWNYETTGQLRFEITNLPYSDFNIRHSWADGKFQRMEECLGKIILGLGAASMVIKKDREETLRRQQEWAEQARLEEEARQRREEFNRKAKVLKGFIQGWRESREVGEFIDALMIEATQQTLTDEERRNLQSLTEWARTLSKRLNPLARLPKSIVEFTLAPRPEHW